MCTLVLLKSQSSSGFGLNWFLHCYKFGYPFQVAKIERSWNGRENLIAVVVDGRSRFRLLQPYWYASHKVNTRVCYFLEQKGEFHLKSSGSRRELYIEYEIFSYKINVERVLMCQSVWRTFRLWRGTDFVDQVHFFFIYVFYAFDFTYYGKSKCKDKCNLFLMQWLAALTQQYFECQLLYIITTQLLVQCWVFIECRVVHVLQVKN